MESLADLLKALQARHADFLNRRWDSLSAEDAKKFTQIERDIRKVSAALGRPGTPIGPDLEESVTRLQATLG